MVHNPSLTNINENGLSIPCKHHRSIFIQLVAYPCTSPISTNQKWGFLPKLSKNDRSITISNIVGKHETLGSWAFETSPSKLSQIYSLFFCLTCTQSLIKCQAVEKKTDQTLTQLRVRGTTVICQMNQEGRDGTWIVVCNLPQRPQSVLA